MINRSRPNTVLRLVFRLPLHLYRLGLGWLFGHRLLLLAHRGRKSGHTHHTVLEVVRYVPATRESVVVSAWGERSDWYRNIRANPALEVRTAGERYVPEQRFLSTGETYAEIADCERRHQLSARTLPRWLGYPLDGTQEARRSFADAVSVVVFSPRREPEADRAGDPRNGER